MITRHFHTTFRPVAAVNVRARLVAQPHCYRQSVATTTIKRIVTRLWSPWHSQYGNTGYSFLPKHLGQSDYGGMNETLLTQSLSHYRYALHEC